MHLGSVTNNILLLILKLFLIKILLTRLCRAEHEVRDIGPWFKNNN